MTTGSQRIGNRSPARDRLRRGPIPIDSSPTRRHVDLTILPTVISRLDRPEKVGLPSDAHVLRGFGGSPLSPERTNDACSRSARRHPQMLRTIPAKSVCTKHKKNAIYSCVLRLTGNSESRSLCNHAGFANPTQESTPMNTLSTWLSSAALCWARLFVSPLQRGRQGAWLGWTSADLDVARALPPR